MPLHCSGRFCENLLDGLSRSDLWAAAIQFVKPPHNRVHGVDFHTLAQTRFVADQAAKFGSQGVGQSVGECG